jgi:uncharacterized protein (TIGR00290 family)
MKKMYFNWSTGKDAALALYFLQKENSFIVDHLLISVNNSINRVSMHGLSRELMKVQLDSVGLDYSTVELPEEPSMEQYAQLMTEAVSKLKNEGYQNTGFGDIFLEDLRKYREKNLGALGIKCHFPLWKNNTHELMNQFVDLGFKAVVISINATKLDQSFCGREINSEFIADLPQGVDPCGENGEFHTFCYDGPIFNKAIRFKRGKQVFKSYKNPSSKNDEKEDSEIGFWFQDLILQE